MKKFISSIIALTMLLSSSIGIYAKDVSAEENIELVTNSEGFITEDWSNVKYISVDEYIEKYGGEINVNNAFNQAELKHRAMLLKADGKSTSTLNTNVSLINETNDLLLSLKEGFFLGMEIESISDLPPTNTNLSIRVKNNNISTVPMDVSKENNMTLSSLNNVINNTHHDGSSYRILYTDQYPSEYDINNNLYEPESGSYFYKYGYSWKGDYRCTTELTFNNTKLYGGSQEVVMYAFIGATGTANDACAIDFGFIANPDDNSRNKGLYAVRNVSRGTTMDVEAYPKVNIVGSSTNPMTLESKTVKLQLTIDTLGNVETVMYANDSMIYYKTQHISGFVSGNDASLTFFEAMSCVDKNSESTNPSSGSYFKNVTFNNTKLYSYNDGERSFGTYGDDTYCVYICKPEDISYSYGVNNETVSIEYN